MRLSSLSLVVLSAACAAAPVRPSVEAEELRELRAQIAAQSSLVSQQQRRIEELEVKLAALASKSQPQPQAAPAPPKAPDPRPALKTVKLGGRSVRRSDRVASAMNPVDRAPRIPSSVQLREPAEAELAQLDVDPGIAQEFDADHAWAAAVQELNDGDHASAERDFLAFVAAHPQHTAADNALYLAGLVRAVRGDCQAALPLFEAVPRKYPAGDAVSQALLERGRCLRLLGRKDEAKRALLQLESDHPDTQEAVAGKKLLEGLGGVE